MLMAGCGGGSSSEAGTPVVGGGGSGSSTTNEVTVSLSLSPPPSRRPPATVTAKVVDSTGASVSGAVVTFTVAGGLGELSAPRLDRQQWPGAGDVGARHVRHQRR
jgi:hypothetical protein